TLGVVELLHRADQAQVALLDQVQEQHAAAGIALGQGDHEPEVGLQEVVLRPPSVLGDPLQLTLVLALDVLGLGELVLGEEAGLDPFGEFDLLGGVEQRDLTDLLQVVLDRIGRGTGGDDLLCRCVVVVGVGEDEATCFFGLGLLLLLLLLLVLAVLFLGDRHGLFVRGDLRVHLGGRGLLPATTRTGGLGSRRLGRSGLGGGGLGGTGLGRLLRRGLRGATGGLGLRAAGLLRGGLGGCSLGGRGCGLRGFLLTGCFAVFLGGGRCVRGGLLLRGRRGLLAGRLRLRGGRDLLPPINRARCAPAPARSGYRTCRTLGCCALCRLQGTQYFLQSPRLDLGGLAGFARFSRSESPSSRSAPERVLQGGMFEFAGQRRGRTRRR